MTLQYIIIAFLITYCNILHDTNCMHIPTHTYTYLHRRTHTHRHIQVQEHTVTYPLKMVDARIPWFWIYLSCESNLRYVPKEMSASTVRRTSSYSLSLHMGTETGS